ncbi:MAG: AMP-binding protein [Pseudomonadota bacterium]
MSKFFDALETRSADQRADDLAKLLPLQIGAAQALSGNARLDGFDASMIQSKEGLAQLPVLRKSDLMGMQERDYLGGLVTATPQQVFQSPGPIYEPGYKDRDWWGFGRFLHALGIGAGDIVQNCFAYHFTPAGMMFENGAEAVGASVFPAGTGQTELQARAAADLGVTVYAGTPDYLKVILEAADAASLDLSKIKAAAVSGGPLFPQLRDYYTDRGITCRQCYATADLGHIAYESEAMDGMIVDEKVLVEIVRPGTGDPVPDGEVGEVVVTTLKPEYPLIRFATGDLSAVLPGQSPCGRTNTRVVGWRGRADQATKVKGMFVRPEQVADFVGRHHDIQKCRVEVSHDGSTDVMVLKLETTSDQDFTDSIRDVFKLRASVEKCDIGSLPNDGLVIADLREI